MKGSLLPFYHIRRSVQCELTLPVTSEPGLMFRERPLNSNTPD
jgi:hypothetical protein